METDSLVFSISKNPPAPNNVGLLRMHWAARRKLYDKWKVMVRAAAGTSRMPGEVVVHVTRRYAVHPLDPDNLYASMKFLLDAMVHHKIIDGDNAKVIKDLKVVQEKSKMKDIGVTVRVSRAPSPSAP